MSQRHRGILLSLLIVSIFLTVIVVVPDHVAAARFSEAFTGETVGELPTGWTEVNPDDGVALVNDTQGSPFTPSLRVTHTADDWEVWSPGVNTSGMGAFSFGWRMRSTVSGGPLMQIGMGLARSYLAGVSVAVRILGTGAIDNSGAGCPSYSGYDAVLNIWYEFRMEFSSGGPGTYDLFMNNTGTYTEFTEIASDCAFTALTDAGNTGYFVAYLDGGGAGFFDALDWSVPTVTPPGDDSLCTGDAYSGTAASDADAQTWSISGQPGAITIDSSTGVISGGVGSATGIFTVTATSTSSAGAGSDTFDITVRTCGGGYNPWQKPEDTFDPPDCEAGTFDVIFKSKYDESQVNLYIWNFGDGTQTQWSSSQRIQHEFPGDGKYTVTHTVQFNDGTTWYESHQVEIGFCEEPEFSSLMWLGFLILLAAMMWLAYIFTRGKRIMWIALILTVVAAGFGAYVFGFF